MSNTTKTTSIARLEEGFLSCLMTCAPEFVDEMKTFVQVDDMFLEPNKALLRAIYSAHDATSGRNRGPAIILSRAAKIQVGDQTLLDDFAAYGIDDKYLDNLESMYTDTTTGRNFAEDIKEGSVRRAMAELSREIYAISKGNSPDFKNQAEVVWSRFAGSGSEKRLKEGGVLVDALWDEVSGSSRKSTKISLTSSAVMDSHMGIVGGRYYLIAMPPHHGKSLLVKNIVLQAAITSDIVPLLFLYEEDPEEAILGFVSMLTGPHAPWVLKNIPEPQSRPTVHKARINEMTLDPAIVDKMYELLRNKGQNIWYQKPTPGEMIEIDNAKQIVKNLSFLAMSAPASIEEMRSIVRMTARRCPGRHIVPILDYVQLATGGSDNYREIGQISRGVKQSCLVDGGGDNPISWFVLSQFNRTHGTSNLKKDVTMNKSPKGAGLTLDSLAESPALGQDPDFIMFGIAPAEYAGDAEQAAVSNNGWGQINYSIMKNRITNNFPDGKIYFSQSNGWISDSPSFDRIGV